MVAKKKAAKKVAKKKAAKKVASGITPGSTQSLPTMDDEFQVPAAVAKAAATYREKQLAKGRATQAFKIAEANIIDAMRTADVSQVRLIVDGNPKVLKLNLKDALKWVPVKQPKKTARKPGKKVTRRRVG